MSTRHILVVDDEPRVGFFLARTLELSNSGYCVTVVESGEAALEVFANFSVDLLITDLRMPGLSGLELLRWARAQRPRTPAILITAYSDPQVQTEIQQLGVFKYLAKPFHVQQLTEVVHGALQTSAAERVLSMHQQTRAGMLAQAVHELRVPLTHVMARIGLLAEQCIEPECDLLQAAYDNAVRLREALDDFTLLAAWGMEQIPADSQQVDVGALLETVQTAVGSLALEYHQDLRFLVNPKSVYVVTDAWLVSMTLLALVANVIKQTPTPGVVTIEARYVSDAVVIDIARVNQAAGEPGAQRTATPGLTLACQLATMLAGQVQLHPGIYESHCTLSLPTSPPASAPELLRTSSTPGGSYGPKTGLAD